jgi:predicted transcriptional regulator
MTTTIQISDQVKKTLEKMRLFKKETYNEIIEDMLEDNIEINELTKKELAERKNSTDFINQEEIEKEFGI